jgi:hypothetical protein
VYQLSEVETELNILKFDQKAETPSGTIVGPGLDFQYKSTLTMDADVLLCKGGDLVNIVQIIDELCLDIMLGRHVELFPTSANMSSADVDSLFNPTVKRRGEVRFPLASDAILRDAEGADLKLSDLQELAKAPTPPQIEFILEFAGFCVETNSFTPIISVSEIVVLPPDEVPKPPEEPAPVVETIKRRVPRLVIKSRSAQ